MAIISAVLQQLSLVLEQAQPLAPPKTPPSNVRPQPENPAPPLLGEILVTLGNLQAGGR